MRINQHRLNIMGCSFYLQIKMDIINTYLLMMFVAVLVVNLLKFN